ncbi:hypothetical protein GQE99_06555 [Maritimibacter sp. DP07]|uniref:Uncharacterized protein n=1 Tax=Maritimibacter harenae TaxID=2606218 RepID=A0A845LXJ7_9RHOB|nr:hypothetical protein [Maritimibacter harenae]MZR12680.1 hypothetical protein [Maritimibacter harenae]
MTDTTETTRRSYVTRNWHDYPEGGDFGTIVEAKDHDEAERLCGLEMAACLLEESNECDHCGDDMGESDTGYCDDCNARIEAGEIPADSNLNVQRLMEHYEYQWHTVDCFDLDEFIQRHERPRRRAVWVVTTNDDCGMPDGFAVGSAEEAEEIKREYIVNAWARVMDHTDDPMPGDLEEAYDELLDNGWTDSITVSECEVTI